MPREDFWLWADQDGGNAEGSGILLTQRGPRRVNYWAYGAVQRVKVDGVEILAEFVDGSDFDPNQPIRTGATTNMTYEDWVIVKDIAQRIQMLDALPDPPTPEQLAGSLSDDDEFGHENGYLVHFVDGRKVERRSAVEDEHPPEIEHFYPQ